MNKDSTNSLQDMSFLLSRLSLIARYNRCLGDPGPEALKVQQDFINGFMDPKLIPSFVAEYETMIESRRPMHKLQDS
jgi:hypothetical protein